ncbi:molybdenum cofactor guanylyltransferase MobA [Solimonas terrae]|uniref:Molybdenum cofactor guanylyltransferase n=1 Tax=Solimonas terrae TaxID=1396819 RepID=A0A6M2BMB8_9GAMM|nr:molybdenum cofactor guanylyltransferase MobA [Solimonas terrae]NGY03401.1 molybdenum cofactor guanylyltransferase [Solimonas terrae]
MNAAAGAARADIEGVILAGGRGLRMLGADKGLSLLHGTPLVRHVLQALRPQVASCMISANRNHEAYAQFDAPLVSDAWPDFRGPLAGIHAATRLVTHDWLLAAPCDTPGLPGDLAARLWCAARTAGADAAYAVIAGEPLYPLCLLHRRRFAALQDALEHGQYAVGRWLAAQGAVAVAIDNWPGPLLNLNTPERLADAHTAESWKPNSPT